jgi:hypothetical protein
MDFSEVGSRESGVGSLALGDRIVASTVSSRLLTPDS